MPGDIGCVALRRWTYRAVIPVKITKGDNLTEQSSQHTQPDDRCPAQHHSLFLAAGQQAENRDPAARSATPSAVAQPFWDVFSHASEHDVAEQQQPATHHDEMAMRSLRLPFDAKADVVDAIDQQQSVPVDEDDYR